MRAKIKFLDDGKEKIMSTSLIHNFRPRKNENNFRPNVVRTVEQIVNGKKKIDVL